ncbi:MAG TPA: hypothetical protein PKA41_01210, partial [Verrucomicrobiota bacterium]|nr:hypothetical protein [Verrucomicrobiota bacterium]
MNRRVKKILLLALAVALLVGASFTQKSLNHDRSALGLTRREPLENAPPVLAFTTVALGSFRGLIANALWIRATELQDEDKFFEMQQLADWITKLEPHYPQVWVHQAWNMSYNISVKFKDFADRWRWVRAGIELLRDEGIKYNPNEPLLYRELAWHFQHKMGHNLDDANMYYKQEWANEMAEVFGKLRKPDVEELIHPATEDAARRLGILTNKYKMDPQFMKEVEEKYGPLEWRLPEAHAIYWAAKGLEKAAQHPEKVKPEDLPNLRRALYQSMQLSFYRGRLVENPFEEAFEFGPNLDIFPKVYDAYDEMIANEPDENQKTGFRRAQRNIVKDAVYFNYVQNRIAEAARWYRVLQDKFPDAPLLDDNLTANPQNTSLEEYAVQRVQGDVNETDRNRIKAIIEGLLIQSYHALLIDEEDRAAGFQRLARLVLDNYQKQIESRDMAIGLPTLEEIASELLGRMLDVERGMPPEMRAVLRTKLRLPAETAPAPSTNSPAASITVPAPATNAPAV